MEEKMAVLVGAGAVLLGWNVILTVWLIIQTGSSRATKERAEQANQKAEILDTFLGHPLYNRSLDNVPKQFRSAKRAVDSLAECFDCDWYSETKSAGFRKKKSK